MIDPLTAIGLASSIVAFVDFGSELLVAGYETYKSAEGALQENLETERLTDDLCALSKALEASPAASAGRGLSRDQRALKDLATMCQGVAEELIDILRDLKVKGGTRYRTWESMRQTIRSVCKKDKIEGLKKRLGEIRSEVDLRLLSLISEQSYAMFATLDDLTRRNKDMHEATIGRLSELKADLVVAAHQRQQQAVAASSAQSQQAQTSAAAFQSLLDKMDRLKVEGSKVATSEKILESLTFSELHTRESKIELAHYNTFAWIFDKDVTPFNDWLQSSNGIFWLNGKAGSGKSTIMKFMVDHWRTTENLKDWTGNKKLIFASYYFWCSGHPMQRTQEGLLQSLLFQLMRQCPDLIPLATPRRWDADESFHRYPDPWSRQELSMALETVVSQSQLPARFCFFIDGLDEYEGDHSALVEDLDNLAKSTDVKICVSSRPWNIFKAAYGGNAKRHITLERYTKKDMAKYVKDTLEEQKRFGELYERDSRAHVFVEELQEKADGVFLWVNLAVKSLLRGLDKGDNVNMLQRRLRTLPKDLDDFFKRMLHSVEDCYKVYTAQALQLAVHAADPLPALLFWFLQADEPDLKAPDFAEVEKMQKEASACINNWCTDLLEVRGTRSFPHTSRNVVFESMRVVKVDFLHRTVRDFLKTKEIHDLLSQQAGTGFDVWVTLCRLYLAPLSVAGVRPDVPDDVTSFFTVSGVIMHYAQEMDIRGVHQPIKALQELDLIGKRCFQQSSNLHWTNLDASAANESSFLGSIDRDDKVQNAQSSFIAYAVTFGLEGYVRCILENEGTLGLLKPKPLLHYALRPQSRHPLLVGNDFPRASIAALLLEKGFDVNLTTVFGDKHKRPIWVQYLLGCLRGRESMTNREVDFAMIALRHDAEVRMHANGVDPGLPVNFSVRDNLRYACPANRLVELGASYDEAVARNESAGSFRSFGGLLRLPFGVRNAGNAQKLWDAPSDETWIMKFPLEEQKFTTIKRASALEQD